MNLNKFYSKYSSSIDNEIYLASSEGYAIMRRSKDVSHDINHLNRMMSILDEVVEHDKNIKESVDLRVMLMSICWHDVWKSKFNQRWGFFIDIFEGLISSLLFIRGVKKYRLPDGVVRNSAYAIRKHSNVQFLKINTMEGRLLRDIDCIEMFSITRLKKSFENESYLFLNKKLFILFHKLFFKSFYTDVKSSSWLNYEYQKKRRKAFLFIEDYLSNT
jgi:hypothetical protein